jgi:protein ImuB
MTRALSLSLPMWPIDLLRRRLRRRHASGRPEGSATGGLPASARAVLLVDTIGQRQVVAHRCRQAAAAGVSAGMTLAHARALLPEGVFIAPHTPERDAEALRALAEWAVRVAPRVAPDPPAGLLMDISGCRRLYGGEDILMGRLSAAVGRLGLRARVAIAPTFGCAWAVARFGASGSIVREGGVRGAIAPLPVRALRVGEEAAIALAEVGITTVSHLFAVPRSALPARFGQELLLRLDQALGGALEVIEPVRPPEPLRVERLFDGPTTNLEGIMLAARGLIDAMCGMLGARQRGARGLRLTLKRSDTSPFDIDIALSRPSRSPAHLWALLRPHVERAHLGFGVEGLMLEALSTGRIRHEQGACWETRDDLGAAPAFAELMDTLVNRCGQERVLRVEPVATHIPERAVRLRPVMEASVPSTTETPVTAADRPSVLFDHPELIEVISLMPDGPPSWLRWRGRDRAIATGIGPERIAPEWWRGHSPTRDYFKVQDQAGQWLWVYRELETGRWFAHGLWA